MRAIYHYGRGMPCRNPSVPGKLYNNLKPKTLRMRHSDKESSSSEKRVFVDPMSDLGLSSTCDKPIYQKCIVITS